MKGQPSSRHPAAAEAGVALYDSAALRRVEAQAAAAFDGDDYELMRRAGQSAWRALLEHWPQARRIVVACGPGNNGGDGYVLARYAWQSGRDVAVVRLQDAAPRAENASRACAEYEASGGRVFAFDGALPDADVVVDALFGIGLSRAPDAAAAAFIHAINAANAPVFALDAPSGIAADTGHRAGAAVRAARTLEFIAPHAGLRTGDALDHAGTCDVATLDVPETAWQGGAPFAHGMTPAALRGFLAPRRRNSHKGLHGHVLCVGGDAGMGGAVALCAEAALRSGAGLASAATRPSHVAALLARLPECMVGGVESASQLAPMLQRADVVAIGPGLGRGVWGAALFVAVLACDKPLVVDADALHLLARHGRAADAVLTPHPGEAAALLGIATAEVQADRFTAAARLAERFGCSVVLKGAGSVVAAPGEIPRVIGAGNPGMAVGGMGDVLTGVIAALRAQGMPAFDAACAGALLHAHAGDLAARAGERGLLPSDVLACVRAAANPSSSA
jgi:hydroxyethylthiazole kinase-like uncharacterized protein yjeF